ncbi:hypothetical protein KTR66_11555 [Roseococcus sp. SDR]|uniref:hypothetical protein n=1 Tax=Roseococcus sp. SDR TaxID=2835532 RepID=UPI001BCBC002|nr:hypothetical protein [Roseococcus sp. SDR]MBS7790635.1 hypothetical protein [Roseococcus sp. SDR]MBV1845949.1 hypothetical protein [Roseococcus sp. SDR]
MATRGLPTWPHLNDSADDLPEAERLLLDAARAWAGPGPAGPVGEAALVLAAAGVEGVALRLDPLLRALPGLQLGCPLCLSIQPSEAALLLAIGAVQQGRRSMALGLLHRLAPPLGAYRAMPALIHLACALRRGGVSFAPRL